MPVKPPKILLCSCGNTMPQYAAAVRRGIVGAEVHEADQLCGTGAHILPGAAEGEPILVCCSPECDGRLAESTGATNAIVVTHLRETATWSSEADRAGPKVAALLAAALDPPPDVPHVKLESKPPSYWRTIWM
jgi:hypothetical protein